MSAARAKMGATRRNMLRSAAWTCYPGARTTAGRFGRRCSLMFVPTLDPEPCARTRTSAAVVNVRASTTAHAFTRTRAKQPRANCHLRSLPLRRHHQ
jgi:hypothetical protein